MTDPSAAAGAPASGWRRPLVVAVLTTGLVTVLSYGLPDRFAATGVGIAFLAVTWFLALRHDEDNSRVRHFGLSLGGVLETEPLSWRRIGGDALRAVGWALLVAAIVYPLFWAGWVWWWKPPHGFVPAPPPSLGNDVLGQLLVIALPEEAFYRGYLQTAFDDAFRFRVRVLGAELGPGLVIASLLFALGHICTEVNVNRLAVFFPALLFGWLRCRTRGIGAGLTLHAMSNLLTAYLAHSYGLLH